MKILLVMLLWFAALTCHAFMFGETNIVIDFTKPASSLTNNICWRKPDRLTTSTNGFGWGHGETNEYFDFWIQSSAIPVAYTWRPAGAVGVDIGIDPSTNYYFKLFLRYSPDKKHWSTWQAAALPRTVIEVPQVASAEYQDLLQQYARLDVPWASDEEAAAKWILQRQPDFFEKHLPFIGYVQFRMEGSLPGNQRIKKLNMRLSWGVSGLSVVPKKPGARSNPFDRWRFEAR